VRRVGGESDIIEYCLLHGLRCVYEKSVFAVQLSNGIATLYLYKSRLLKNEKSAYRFVLAFLFTFPTTVSNKLLFALVSCRFGGASRSEAAEEADKLGVTSFFSSISFCEYINALRPRHLAGELERAFKAEIASISFCIKESELINGICLDDMRSRGVIESLEGVSIAC